LRQQYPDANAGHAVSVQPVTTALYSSTGGERGLLVPPRDAPAMVEALERLAADRDLRERLIRAGMAHAEANTMEARLDAVAEFFATNTRAR